jgi:hypothetical protein
MTSAAVMSVEEERLRPLYARMLRLRHVDPGGTLCFVFFEGTVALGLLLALAELVSWWGVLVLPATVAVMVKVNDVVAAAVVRSAARVPAQERDRFRREIQPAVGRARVPGQMVAEPGRIVPLTAVGSDGADAAGPVSDTPDPDRYLANRLGPAVRPVGMSAAVWARLERGGRREYRPDQDLLPRPTVDLPNRSRRQGADRIRASDPSRPPAGNAASPGLPSPPSPTPIAGRAAEAATAGVAERSSGGEWSSAGVAERSSGGERSSAGECANAGAADRPKAGDGTVSRKNGAGRGQAAAAQSQHSQGQQQIALPGAGGGRPLNRGLSERLDQRPVRRWLARLDPTDTVRQRGRQSAKRRYE